MSYSQSIFSLKCAFIETSKSIRDWRGMRISAKAEGQRLREELRKHQIQINQFIAPEQPRKGELLKAIGEQASLCSRYHARKLDERPNARHLHLAYAFARGKTYASCERSCDELPSTQHILANLTAAGIPATEDQVKAWLKGAFLLVKPEREASVAAVA